MRLLSFLSDIEHALKADDPSPLDGAWENSRVVNYRQGVARLMLAARKPGSAATLGSVTVQEFQLADGSCCIKAHLAWRGVGESAAMAIYENPEIEWTREARKVAGAWQAGRDRAQSLPLEALASASVADEKALRAVG
jgi:hypothetical protein